MQATDLKKGTIYKEDGQPLVVEKYEHTKTARGGATIKVKVRNLLTGQYSEKKYISGASVENSDVVRKNAQYLYKEGNFFHFMDPNTYEQIRLESDRVGESSKFLLEGEQVQMMYFEGNAVSIDLPITMAFEIGDTVPGYKGNTVSNVLKEATLTNGTEVKVPTFIKKGDRIKVDTRTGEYISKA